MRFKILFLSSWFPNKLEPTNGNFVQRHAEAVSLLHDVEIIHAIGDFQQTEKFIVEDALINGVRTVIVYYRNSNNPVQNFLRRMAAYQKGFNMASKPDLVHANVMHNSMLFAVFIKKRYNIPFVISEHWSGFLEINRSKLSYAAKYTAKIIAKHAEIILPVSHHLKQNLSSLKIGNNYEVIENVVDTELFSAKREKRNEKFIFLHVSNLVSLKNPQKIIEAAIELHQRNKNFQLKIGGDGDIEHLRNYVIERSATEFIKIFGELKLSEVAEMMGKSNCFILFSKYENFPCVLLESISSGTPVIATKVGGIPEIVDETNGILISTSQTELIEAMQKMLLHKQFDPEDLHQQIEENYSYRTIARKFDAIYRKFAVSAQT